MIIATATHKPTGDTVHIHSIEGPMAYVTVEQDPVVRPWGVSFNDLANLAPCRELRATFSGLVRMWGLDDAMKAVSVITDNEEWGAFLVEDWSTELNFIKINKTA